MNSKYKDLNAPEVFFKDCFKKSKIVYCQNRIFLQNNVDITDDVYLRVFPPQIQNAERDEKDSFGMGLIFKKTPEQMLHEVRSSISKGIKTIPADRFISPNMQVSISRILRYAQFDVAFENLVIRYVYDGEFIITIGGETYNLIKGNTIILAPGVHFSQFIDNDDTEEYIQNKSKFNKNDILVADIVSYLHNNYSTTSLLDVSGQFSLSAKHLSRMLKERTGMNYMSLITDIKLEKVKEFLKSTDIGIEDICSIVGYSDSRQLRFMFSQKYGMSPSEYRRRIKGTGMLF